MTSEVGGFPCNRRRKKFFEIGVVYVENAFKKMQDFVLFSPKNTSKMMISIVFMADENHDPFINKKYQLFLKRVI